MNKSKVYQNGEIIQSVGGSKIRCCHPSITPNKLYTIYEEFDIRYYYKMMKEGIYQEIEEGILFQIKRFIEGVLECQAEEICNARYYKHSEGRKDYRNGYRERGLLTSFGKITLRIPRVRLGSIGKGILERYRRRDKKIDKLIKEMFFNGVSVRDIKKALKRMLGKDYYYLSPQTVSNITKKLNDEITKWHNREIKDEYSIIYLDGVYLKVKSPIKSKRRCVLVCMGIDKEGRAKILGYKIASYVESENAWMSFINELYQRGLEGKNIELCVIDGNSGLKNAINFIWPSAKIQRCWAHKIRNILSYVGVRYKDDCANDLRKIYNVKNLKGAIENFKEFKNKWELLYPKAVNCLEKDLEELLLFYGYDERYWKLIRTTNKIERVFKEVRRRTNNIGAFTNVNSLERIIYYKFNEYNERANVRRRIRLEKFSKKLVNISNPIYTQILT
jgi:putative transposase